MRRGGASRYYIPSVLHLMHVCLSNTTQIADLRGQHNDMMEKDLSGLEVTIMGNACNQNEDVLTPVNVMS